MNSKPITRIRVLSTAENDPAGYEYIVDIDQNSIDYDIYQIFEVDIDRQFNGLLPDISMLDDGNGVFTFRFKSVGVPEMKLSLSQLNDLRILLAIYNRFGGDNWLEELYKRVNPHD